MDWLLRIWLPIAVAVTGLCFLVFVSVQQNYRATLNDPQIQMAEDAARALSGGAVPASLVTRKESIDGELSLAPWLAVYDAAMNPLEASAVLDGKPPLPPAGSFQYVRENGDDAPLDTWETKSGTRIALVLIWVPERQMYVAAGRNMREFERRIWDLRATVGMGWIALLAATLFGSWIGVHASARTARGTW